MKVNVGILDRTVRVIVGLLHRICDSVWISEHGLELGRLDRHRSDRHGHYRILPGVQPVRLLLLPGDHPSARRYGPHSLANVRLPYWR